MKRNWLSYMCMAALLSGALTSCNESSFLNLSDPNHFTESNFWKDKADAESALAAAYSPIKGAMYGYFSAFDGWLNLNGRGDDIFTIKGRSSDVEHRKLPEFTVYRQRSLRSTLFRHPTSQYRITLYRPDTSVRHYRRRPLND